jgi:hypothetical protein
VHVRIISCELLGQLTVLSTIILDGTSDDYDEKKGDKDEQGNFGACFRVIGVVETDPR